MITAKIIRGKDTGKKFVAKVPKVDSAVQNAVKKLAIKVSALTKRKLSGEVLNVRSGRLRRSIHPEFDFAPGRAIAVVGTNVVYAKAHEYGATIVPRNKKALAFKIGEKWIVAKKVVMPERSFLRTALRELAPEIRSEIAKATGVALQ